MAIPYSLIARSWLSFAFLATLLCFFLSPTSRGRGESRLRTDQTSRAHPYDDIHTVDLSASPANGSQLVRRDGGTYTCKKDVPCKTYACCGSFLGTDTGTCGFGDTFCGDDCDSQCDAKADCGQYADPPGKTCPLNVCCSEYGFCGSTADFCEAGCQSNCVLEPPVPDGGSGISVLGNKVIGYYESWADRKSCRNFPPSAIPVEGLTHVNFAFAYIDPDTLDITTMDSKTPEGLFAETTDLKQMKSFSSELEVFISLGGWTFSDNDTSTQPLFPEIAGDAKKRQTFADNLVSFMTRYGFDGVDLDWEYPGAPDRGGLQEKDRKNFIALMKTLRETFKASPRGNFGLTFTIPTSYWYLRWFDVPGLLEHADWVNMMSYDLHGVWDENNPIGSIVQAHTNLTEIQLAADLLWRNNVPPGKVVLGVGFYGRSFQLDDTDCSEPGCQFSGPGKAGSCTDSAGTLAYFEIMDVLNGDDAPEPVHDKAAAVNYLVYGDDKDQWISYDDEKTFKQKLDWANSVGLGGVMIWSVDQDDNDFSALSGLIGEPLPSFAKNLERTAQAETGHWASVNGQACQISGCSGNPSPPEGFGVAPNGKFQGTCGSYRNKYVYCPLEAMPQSCTWRGSGSCHGQCHEGEVTLTHSRYGSKRCLAPGMQAFCCVSNTWSNLVGKCGWASAKNGCGDCPSDAPHAVSSRSKRSGLISTCKQKYCCPYEFQNCHWVGKGTCDDNECSSTDVEVARDPMGDNGWLCASGFNSRQKTLCCNTPDDTNPFLPVPLEDLFPTLPPAEDVPAFDRQALDSQDGLTGLGPFLFVVIDGPPGTVSNLNKRDGSHIEFITKGEHHGPEPQVAHFVCMDDSPESNCDEMSSGGLEGTVLRMPDDMGFAQWAVAHAVRESNIPLPDGISKRAPATSSVYELEYSYDFSRVKRDSGDIFFRVDYSNDYRYYARVVQAAHQKRDIHRRFWSPDVSSWKGITDSIRTLPYIGDYKATISKSDFNTLLYGNDGHDKGCSDAGKDGFLKLGLAGSMTSTMQFGFTLVGKLQPYGLEEAYGYFDTDLDMIGHLSFDGKGVLDINDGYGAQRDLFASPITNVELSHPGIVSFSPRLNAQVSLQGSGEIDGMFNASFVAGSSKTMRTNAPLELGDFDGDILTSNLADAVNGKLALGDTSEGTVFAVNFDVEASLQLKIFGYETSLQEAGAEFTSRTPFAIRVSQDSEDRSPKVIYSPQQATADVVQFGAGIAGWDDQETHRIGTTPSSRVVFTGGESPEERDAPDINDFAVFGDRDYMGCSGGSFTGELVCTYAIYNGTDEDDDDDSKISNRRRFFSRHDKLLASSKEVRVDHGGELEKRAGPNAGAARKYPIFDVNNPNDAFMFTSATYPSGNNGADLDTETHRNERYAIANPLNCPDTSITANGIQGTHYDQMDSDHIDDLSIFPNEEASFLQTGELDMSDGLGTVYRSSNPTISYGDLYNFFAHEYALWVSPTEEPNPPPGSAMRDFADALGSSSNPTVMVNLEHYLNVLKGRMYTTNGRAISTERWDDLMGSPSQGTSEEALSGLRGVFSMFNYLNSPLPARARTQSRQDRQAALLQYDDLFGRTHRGRPERAAPLDAEFWVQWDRRAVNFARRDVSDRLDHMESVYLPLSQGRNPLRALANSVLDDIADLRARIQTEIVL
ncbi:chitotriosidase-1 [Xylariomycetidae sp. FL0641]|nr:chitotriosidase-1 [Xylariomycetidae sp. FL0641]